LQEKCRFTASYVKQGMRSTVARAEWFPQVVTGFQERARPRQKKNPKQHHWPALVGNLDDPL
jgi:hypothetical protein